MSALIETQEQQLRKRAFKALTTENHQKPRIAGLQHELHSLEQDLVSNHKTTQHCLEQFAKSECLILSHQIMTNLPRELCDMIYQHTSTRSAEDIERERFRTTLDPVTRLYSYDPARWKASHFPEHYWNAEGEVMCYFVRDMEKEERRDECIEDPVASLGSGVQKMCSAGYKVKLIVDEQVFSLQADMDEEWAAVHG
ncbi:Nn.00g084990.m01.CDS01 [Neocucurbitaria sp. VM-36]